MQRVPLDRSQVQCLHLFRVALSEPDMSSRLSAISTIKLQVQSEFVLQYLDNRPVDRPWGPGDLEELAAIAETEKARLGAARDFAELVRRYDGGMDLGNERRLNVAEQIGKMILLSVKEGKFSGVHSDRGVLAQLRKQGLASDIRGARDRDSIAGHWKIYAGVVHVGIALDFCEDNPDDELDVLKLAESFRMTLAESCPRNTSQPYVAKSEQISFGLSSMP